MLSLIHIYFQTVVKNLPGGVTVIQSRQAGQLVPEYISEGFAEMAGMSYTAMCQAIQQDFTANIHPQDREMVRGQLLRDVYKRQGQKPSGFTCDGINLQE